MLGVAETAALAAILTPGHARTKEWAYAGLVFVYGGAATSHVAAAERGSAGAGAAVSGADRHSSCRDLRVR